MRMQNRMDQFKGFLRIRTKKHVNFTTTEAGTILDHVYVSGEIQVDVRQLPTYFSYHDAVSCTLLNSYT